MPPHPLRRRLGRRAFLSSLGSLALSAMLSACHRLLPPVSPVSIEETQSPPTPARQAPTPTAQRTDGPGRPGTPSPTTQPTQRRPLLTTRQSEVLLPFASSKGDHAQEATVTPSPRATDTPVPTSTPWPTPTPFPPGPPTKLGLHVTHHRPQVLELVRTGNVAVIKTISQDRDFLSQIKALSPHTLLVGRLMVEQIDLDKVKPGEGAQWFVNRLLPIAADPSFREVFDAWEGYNEPVAVDAEQMKRLAELEAERVRLLASEGIRSVIGNFGTGHPALELWPQFFPALEAAREHDGFLGLHEYSAPTMQFGTHAGGEGWLTLRYRKAYRQYLIPAGLEIPLIITECGIDGMVRDRPGPEGEGWKGFVNYWADQGMGIDGPGNYIEQLAWYDSELMKDSYVVGAAIFTMTTTREWRSYEILGDAASILHQYLSVHPVR
jgi:hypothetical protein